jgi:hypothetical protein
MTQLCSGARFGRRRPERPPLHSKEEAMHRALVAILIVVAALPLLAQNVTLPLEDYDKLRALDRPESITVVDTLTLSGSFKERNLTVTFTGKSVGRRVATAVLQTSSGLVLWGCSGSAVISRGDDGFRITPLADSFTATCKIAAPGSDRLELTGTRDVLAIASSVSDGELVAGDRGDDGTHSYSLVRQAAGGAENIPPTATGHYLITLLPDETRFRYAIEVHNPNRSRRPFEVRLQSGEHLQQVDAVAPYELVDDAYRFDLPPGDTNLVLTGQLTGETFTPPVDASLQYLAIENHPIVRPLIDATVKRISAAEAGVPIQFRGPQAFLLGKGETLRWKTTKLEALHTVSYALSGAQHTFFIPAEGNVLGESLFAIDNQGASDVKLPLQPEPTYVSIENEAMLMTKGPDGKLTVPLSAGKQQILVQHRQSIRHVLGFGIGRLVVPQLGVPATSLQATINYPRQWYPLVQSFSTRTKFWTPSTEMVLLFLVLLLWTERLLAWLAIPLRQRLAIAVLLAAASASFDLILGLVALGNAFLTIAWLIQYFKREKWTLVKGLVAAVIGGAILLAVVVGREKSIMPTSQAPVSSAKLDEFRVRANTAINVTTEAAPQKAEPNYQGLPARFDIPSGEKQSTFSQELLSTDREHAIAVFLISSTVVWLIGVVFVALAAWKLWQSRRALAAGVRTRLAPAAVVPDLV